MGESCKLCERAKHYNPGLIGENYSDKRIMFVLHISDERAVKEGYVEAYNKTYTAKTIDKILNDSNLNLDDIILTNFYKCIIPGDKIPRKQEYFNCKSILTNQIEETRPKKIVLFGPNVYNNLFENSEKKFRDVVGNKIQFGNLEAFVSYHPVGLRFQWAEEKERIYGGLKDYLIE